MCSPRDTRRSRAAALHSSSLHGLELRIAIFRNPAAATDEATSAISACAVGWSTGNSQAGSAPNANRSGGTTSGLLPGGTRPHASRRECMSTVSSASPGWPRHRSPLRGLELKIPIFRTPAAATDEATSAISACAVGWSTGNAQAGSAPNANRSGGTTSGLLPRGTSLHASRRTCMSTVSSASRGCPRPQSAMPASGRMTTVPSRSGQAPIRGDEYHGQNVASSATQSCGMVAEGAAGAVTGSPYRHDLDLHATPFAGEALHLDQRAHGPRVREIAVSDRRESLKVGHVGEERLDLHDVAKAHSRGLEYGSDQLEDELRLRRRVERGDYLPVAIDGQLPRDIESARAVVLHQEARAVGPARGGVVRGIDEGLLHVGLKCFNFRRGRLQSPGPTPDYQNNEVHIP